VAALFGSSLHVVSGPTNMISLALFATLAPLALVGSPAYIQLALGVTLLVGAMQWLIGALRLGGWRTSSRRRRCAASPAAPPP
jgi:SulP family sulfate permease